jgi:hypothetical protein
MRLLGLSGVGDILPDDIAPRDGATLVAPSDWPSRFADEVRKLSGRSMGRREVAMGHLRAAVEVRRKAGKQPLEVTQADCKLALQWLYQTTADAMWAVLPEEKEATATFGGGLREAVEEASAAEGVSADMYEHSGKFNIGTHLK